LNRFTAKLVHGFGRLAFWRKPIASIQEERASLTGPEPATDHQVEAESSAAAETPGLQTSWFARLKGKLRRPPKSEQPEADEETPRASALESDAAEEAVHTSRVPRVRAVLANKWVVISGGSVMLIAVVATLAGMLLQSGQEKKQLQIELVAAQQKLKQVDVMQKPVGIKPAPLKSAVHPTVASAAPPPAQPRPASVGGECELSNPENAAENLKRCIDSFNAMSE
jgi:hypothetical protein